MRHWMWMVGWTLGLFLAGSLMAVAGEEPTSEEQEALDKLASEVSGVILYTREGRVRKVVIGQWEHIDLGEGDYARWSPDGKQIAVQHDETIYVMDADGENRRKLVTGAGRRHGCPIYFHRNGEEIMYLTGRSGYWTVNIETGETKDMGLPSDYTGEASMSANGKRLAVRRGSHLFAVDLEKNTHSRYARGCSPGISPDGSRLMRNLGGHREMAICDWDGENESKIDTRTQTADPEWNDHSWSNHNDYIAAMGQGGRGETYVVKISENRATRVTFEGKTYAPDVFIESE